MQKLYKVAFQRILTKIGADKTQVLNVQALQNLLKEKNVPLPEIDQNIFHKLPREEVKNLVRNPCPINKAEQTSSDIVTNAKAIRGALNIVEKKVCFKCPFVSSCDRAFVEPPANYMVENPLPNLLISMKNIAQIQSNDKIKNRSWFSGVRVCDSLNSVFDDLLQGGEEFKIFKQERNALRDEADAQRQQQTESDKKQLLRNAKKNRIPGKDIYAQVPSSKRTQNNTEKEGEQAFEQLSKGPQNIFKKKKSEQFIKLAQKYIHNDKVEGDQENRQQRTQIRRQRRPQFEKRQFDQAQNQDRKPYRRQERSQYSPTRGKQSINREQRPRYENKQRGPRDWKQQDQSGNQRYQRRDDRNRGQSTNNYGERNTQQYERGNRQFDRNNQQSDRNAQPYDRNNQQYDRNNQQTQRYRNQSEERDPRIRRFSKDRPNETRGYQSNRQDEAPRRNKLDKFYTNVKDEKTDEEQILSSFNKRQTPRSNKLPRDAKYSNSERGQRGQSRDFSERDVKEFDRLEKIPKILKTEFASKQDVQERVHQQASEEQPEGERKGRRIKRG